MKVSKTFCAYPFVHQYLAIDRSVSVCCYNPNSYQSDKNQSLIQSFNSEKMNSLRESMLLGEKNSMCHHCYDLEDKGMTSPRQLETKVWEDYYSKQLEKNIIKFKNNELLNPISHDIRFSNKCALKCKTCIPVNSSSINVENKQIQNSLPKKLKSLSMFSTPDDQNKNQVEDIPINKDTTWITLVGGEPLIEEKNTKLLQKAIELKIDPVIVINTSMARKNNKLFEILKNFSKVNYVVSLDGIGKVNDYIRSGSQFDEVYENINASRHNISGFNTVVSMYNIFKIREILEWVMNNFPNKKHFINLCVDHSPTELKNLPYILRQSAIQECKKLYENYKNPQILDIATFLEENNYSETGFEQFIEFTKFIDGIRGDNILDVEPRYAPYFA